MHGYGPENSCTIRTCQPEDKGKEGFGMMRNRLPETSEADIDEEISAASGDEKDAERWN